MSDHDSLSVCNLSSRATHDPPTVVVAMVLLSLRVTFRSISPALPTINLIVSHCVVPRPVQNPNTTRPIPFSFDAASSPAAFFDIAFVLSRVCM